MLITIFFFLRRNSERDKHHPQRVALPRCWIPPSLFPTDRFGGRSRHAHISIARWALSSLRSRIATFALQRTFRFTPLGLAFCFFPFSNTSTLEQHTQRERELGTGILLEEPNPTGSRPRDLIGLCRQHTSLARDFYLKNPTPNGSRPSGLIGLDRVGCWLACQRETEHLWFKATHSHEQHPRMF